MMRRPKIAQSQHIGDACALCRCVPSTKQATGFVHDVHLLTSVPDEDCDARQKTYIDRMQLGLVSRLLRLCAELRCGRA